MTGVVGMVIVGIGMRFDRDLIRWAGFGVIVIAFFQVVNAAFSLFAPKFE